MPNEISPEIMEAVLVDQDASKLTPQQRLDYLNWLCVKHELNPASHPFIWIRTRDKKLKPYPTKGAAEQIRKREGARIEVTKEEMRNGLFVVHVTVTNAKGRSEAEIGAVPFFERMDPSDRANAMMKAFTVAKRRASLAIGGLGMTSEEEMDNVKGARTVNVDANTGEIIDEKPKELAPPDDEPKPSPELTAIATNIIRALKDAPSAELRQEARDAYREEYAKLDYANRERVQSVMRQLELS